MNFNAIQHHRLVVWDRGVARPVDAGGEDLDGVAPRCQGAAQCMDGKDWAAIPHRRQVGWNYVQKSQRRSYGREASPIECLARDDAAIARRRYGKAATIRMAARVCASVVSR